MMCMSIIVRTAAGSFPVEQRAVRARMDTNAVQMVLQMGYTRDLLHRVIENRLATVGKWPSALFYGSCVPFVY